MTASGNMYLAKKDFILRKVGDSYALISVGANIADFNGYIRMNESAVLLWNLLQEPRTKGELCQAIMREYGLSEEQAVEDTEEYLEMLLKENMAVIL